MIEPAFRLVNSEETPINSAETPINSAETQQRKENKIIEKKITEKESTGEKTQASVPTPAEEKARGEFNNVILTEAEYDALCSEYKNIDRTIERLSQYMAASGKSYSSHYAVLKRWAQEDKQEKSEKSEDSSYDVDEFFTLALARSGEKMNNKRRAQGPPS